MARCPKCNTKMPFFKIGFLSKVHNWIICPSCEAYCVAEKSLLSAIGMIGGALGTGIGFWVVRDIKEGGSAWYFGVLIFIALIFGMLYYQNNSVKLTVTSMPDDFNKEPAPKEKFKGPIPSKSDPIAYLKYQYHGYSKEKLMEIAQNKDYREEANIAAKELLEEKYNT